MHKLLQKNGWRKFRNFKIFKGFYGKYLGLFIDWFGWGKLKLDYFVGWRLNIQDFKYLILNLNTGF